MNKDKQELPSPEELRQKYIDDCIQRRDWLRYHMDAVGREIERAINMPAEEIPGSYIDAAWKLERTYSRVLLGGDVCDDANGTDECDSVWG